MIHRVDLHGALVEINKSKNDCLIGIKGIIILETKNTFNVIQKNNTVKSKF